MRGTIPLKRLTDLKRSSYDRRAAQERVLLATVREVDMFWCWGIPADTRYRMADNTESRGEWVSAKKKQLK